MAYFEQSNIRFANLPVRKVLTVNMGKRKNGFNVFKKCGSAEAAEANATGSFSLFQTYHNREVCRHGGTVVTGIYLGYEFLTDMFMLDISYDSTKFVGKKVPRRKAYVAYDSSLFTDAGQSPLQSA